MNHKTLRTAERFMIHYISKKSFSYCSAQSARIYFFPGAADPYGKRKFGLESFGRHVKNRLRSAARNVVQAVARAGPWGRVAISVLNIRGLDLPASRRIQGENDFYFALFFIYCCVSALTGEVF